MTHPLVNLDKRILTYWDIAQLQDMVNSTFDPIDMNWRASKTDAEFRVAAMLKLSELTTSMPWKWWRAQNIKIDEGAIKIKAVQLLHCLITISLLEGIPQDECGKVLCDLGVSNIDTTLPDELVFNPDITRANLKAISTIGQLIFHHTPIGFDGINFILRACGLTDLEVSGLFIASMTINKLRWGITPGSGNPVVHPDFIMTGVVTEFINNDDSLLSDIPNKVMSLARP